MRNKKLAKGVALLLVGALTFTAMSVSAATVSDNEVIPEADYCVVQEEASEEMQRDTDSEQAESGTTEEGLVYDVITAEDGSTKSITITGYSGEATEVSIPVSINSIPVTSVGNSAFNNCCSLTHITIPEGVTNIGESAFYDCSSLESIRIPESVTSIGEGAFKGCKGLQDEKGFVIIRSVLYDYCGEEESIIIPENVTSIGVRAFERSDLTEITIPESVTNIGSYAFSWCRSLENIEIPSSVMSIEERAFDNSGLTKITIPESVTNIGSYAFAFSALKDVVILGKVTSIGEGVFWNCDYLTSIEIGAGVTSIEQSAFGHCISLSNITLPESVTSIGTGAFQFCSSLTCIKIPESVTSIGNYAFQFCSNLTCIEIPKSTTGIGNYAFYYCSSLTDVYYTGSEVEWEKIEIGDFNDELAKATIHYASQTPDNFAQVKKAAETVVEQIKAIGTVTLEKKEAIDKARAAYNALTDEAKKLVSAADLKLLTDAEAKYAQLKADKEAADKVAAEAAKKTEAEKAAKEAIGAENVVDDATYVVAENQTVIYQVNGNKDAKSVKIPATIRINDKDYAVTEIVAGAFKNCSSLKTVSIGSNVTTIGDGAFQGCSKLTKVTIPAKVTKIGKNAFYNCKKLKTITIKSTSLKTVGKSAFKKIAKNATIKVPKKQLTKYKKLLKGKVASGVKIKK